MTISTLEGKTIETIFYDPEHRLLMRQVQSFSGTVEKDGVSYVRQQVELTAADGSTISKGVCLIQRCDEPSLVQLKLVMHQWLSNDTEMKIEIPGQKSLEYPLAMKAGDKLQDGYVSLEMSDGSGMEKLVMKISDRRVTQKEVMIINGETRRCFRISCTMAVSRKEGQWDPPLKMEEWFVPGVGVLKARTPDGSCLEVTVSDEKRIISPSNQNKMSPFTKKGPKVGSEAAKASNTQQPADFVVRLDGITLAPDAQERIEKGIQKVVLEELAGYTPAGTSSVLFPTPSSSGAIISIPIKWPGYWLRVLSADEFEEIEEVLTIGQQVADAKQIKNE